MARVAIRAFLLWVSILHPFEQSKACKGEIRLRCHSLEEATKAVPSQGELAGRERTRKTAPFCEKLEATTLIFCFYFGGFSGLYCYFGGHALSFTEELKLL
jgi:hypothetical protein